MKIYCNLFLREYVDLVAEKCVCLCVCVSVESCLNTIFAATLVVWAMLLLLIVAHSVRVGNTFLHLAQHHA